MTDLEQFIADDDEGSETRAAYKWVRPVLVLSFGELRYGVLAEHVENVMGYRDPSRVPQAKPALAGVLQDRGRMLALVRHPAGEGKGDGQRPTRVVVCTTSAGRLGLPATTTHTIRTLKHTRTPKHGELIDDTEGPVSFLDPEEIVKLIRTPQP